MRRFCLYAVLLLSLAQVGCAGKRPAPEAPVVTEASGARAPVVPAEAKGAGARTWKDRLGITYVASSLACLYEIFGFFNDSRYRRSEPSDQGKRTIFTCLPAN